MPTKITKQAVYKHWTTIKHKNKNIYNGGSYQGEVSPVQSLLRKPIAGRTKASLGLLV